MKRRHAFVLLLLALIAISLATAAPSVEAAPSVGPTAAPLGACRNSAWLTLRSENRWYGIPHYYLEAPFAFNGSRYTIIQMQEYRSYNWSFWGNFSGRSRFGIDTTWALSHPMQLGGPWLLLYNC